MSVYRALAGPGEANQIARGASEETEMTRIYVGNLPFSASNDDVRNLFEAFGGVESVTLITDRETGRPRGFGFVEMNDSEEADTAIRALDNSEMGGRTLKVNEARPREQRPRRW